jgi:hypothetical protein
MLSTELSLKRLLSFILCRLLVCGAELRTIFFGNSRAAQRYSSARLRDHLYYHRVMRLITWPAGVSMMAR